MSGHSRKLWSDKRLGFRHELILTLVDRGFTYREAHATIEAIFGSIKSSLQRHEEVVVENFGTWIPREVPRDKRRRFKFGKIIRVKPWKVRFRMDDDALQAAYDPAWRGHASWDAPRKRREDYIVYEFTIMRFFLRRIPCDNWNMIWHLRFNAQWYEGVFRETRLSEVTLRPIEDAEQVIDETEPSELAKGGESRLVDLVSWYARWTALLDVDSRLWQAAERKVEHHHRMGDWGGVYKNINDRLRLGLPLRD